MKKIVSVILVLVLALTLGATAFADSGVPITKNPTDEARCRFRYPHYKESYR